MLKSGFSVNMKKIFAFAVIVFVPFIVMAQGFYIKSFHSDISVNRDASIDIREKILVHFDVPHHGIFRMIPYKYPQQKVSGQLKANAELVNNGYRYTIIENIRVKDQKFDVNSTGDFKEIKIGAKDKMVSGDQLYEISYKLIGAINFFDNFSELYLNITGNQWQVAIGHTSFEIHFYKPLPDSATWFVSTGAYGSRENKSESKFIGDSVLKGTVSVPLLSGEGVTAGVRMPENYLTEPDLKWRDKEWLALPVIFFFLMFWIWKKWGKDPSFTVQTEFYPPENVSPSVAGYVIDRTLNRRDLTALIPYWGAAGFLTVNELHEKKLLGIIKSTDYEFKKIKELPDTSYNFEKTMFNGLFKDGDTVLLSDLKDSFYSTMSQAKSDLENEINKAHYYVRYTRTTAVLLPIFGGIVFIVALVGLFINYPIDFLFALSVAITALIVLIFGSLMSKKTEKGTELYARLLGFKEFLKSVEKDRLKEFLKQDENYFDMVLPYAIVFDIADTWKDKLKGLDIPPPTWYSGYYPGSVFNAALFMGSLDNSMKAMGQSFYSTPSSGGGGSSGGSFGGGGFSGGGFGGGGGGGW